MFNSPEGQSSTGKPVLKNAERRTSRGQRRVIRRRRQRMAQIRSLFQKHQLLQSGAKDALAGHGSDPWDLRALALDEAVSPRHFALILGHIAKHRGFKSNKKGERANKADDASKMLTAIDAARNKLAQYRTVGEMFARDPAFAARKRNREGDYTRSILRDDQTHEVKAIFAAQRRFGNERATAELEEAFNDIAFFQRPLQSSLELIGDCPFVEGQKRATAFAPSFEIFRFLSKLVTVRIVEGRDLRALAPQEIRDAFTHFGKTKAYTWKSLRTAIALPPAASFAHVSPDKESKDFVRASGAAAGTKTLMDILIPVLGAVEAKSLLARAKPLDEAMTVIAFNEDIEEIVKGLKQCDLPPMAADALCEAAAHNSFQFVKGTGHISSAAAQRLNPHLAEGLRYDQACVAEGWDHAAQQAWELDDITSPVAQKAAREMLKQVKILEREYGPFDRVHVEMARDVGKSIEERGEIERGLRKRTSQRDRVAQELRDTFGLAHVTGDDILRYELWKEQGERCLYSGKGIEAGQLYASDNVLQVDHILPFSRFADNSFHNKTLCFTVANQQKKNRTPFEWIGEEKAGDWERFCLEVEGLKYLKGIKKRNYLLMDAAEKEEKFLNRNLNDTRYALRVVLGLLRRSYPDFADGVDKEGNQIMRRRVFARPGAITSALRRVWGGESLKKDPETGERLPDDRHHALDAIVTACCSEALLQHATRHAQAQKRRGETFELRHLPPPWGEPGVFRREVVQAVESVFVSRPESGRLRGKGHEASIKQIRDIDGEEKVFERKAVADLTLADIDNIPTPEPYGKIVDPAKLRDQLVENLRTYIEQREALKAAIKAIKGRSDEKTALQARLASLFPLSPKGDVVKKVRLQAKSKKAVEVRGGSADRSDMVRVDIFTKANKKGVKQNYLVPIYRSDVYTADTAYTQKPPNRAVVANKAEENWPVMDRTYQFLFSLHSFSLIEIVRPDGEILLGYFRGLDRSTGAIAISSHENSTRLIRGIGAKTLRSFKKIRVDRLGNRFEVKREKRTWRGKVCI